MLCKRQHLKSTFEWVMCKTRRNGNPQDNMKRRNAQSDWSAVLIVCFKLMYNVWQTNAFNVK